MLCRICCWSSLCPLWDCVGDELIVRLVDFDAHFKCMETVTTWPEGNSLSVINWTINYYHDSTHFPVPLTPPLLHLDIYIYVIFFTASFIHIEQAMMVHIVQLVCHQQAQCLFSFPCKVIYRGVMKPVSALFTCIIYLYILPSRQIKMCHFCPLVQSYESQICIHGLAASSICSFF